MNTYKLKQDISGNNYIEMITPEGVVSFVPIAEGNADYQRYLNPEAEHFTPMVTDAPRS